MGLLKQTKHLTPCLSTATTGTGKGVFLFKKIMKTETEIRLLLSNFEEEIINYESVLNSGLSKKDKKNLIEVVQQLQSELNLLKWVLNEESNTLPF